jgi:hypothetical protein
MYKRGEEGNHLKIAFWQQQQRQQQQQRHEKFGFN